jgi:uncharacterized protein YjbI with pentapeptide repeats
MSEQQAPSESPPPDWRTCTTAGCIGICLEGQDACLAHVDAQGRKTFLSALRPGARLDLRGTPIDPELLGQLLAGLRPEGGPLTLGDARFERARFSREAGFRGVQFSGVAGFNRAQFSGDARFNGAFFSGSAEFDEVQFSGEARFNGAQFSGAAGFGGARFSKEAGFGEAQFSGVTTFRGAQFSQAGALGPLLAATKLTLDRASFAGAMVVDVAAARLSCVGTAFQQGATLRARYAEIVLDGAVFAKPSTLAYAEDTFRRPPGHPVGKGPWFYETPLRASGQPPRPRLLSLRRVDVSTLVLADVDLSACLFHGAHHLDSLRIEGTRPFATTPGAWRLRLGRWWLPVWWRWSRRQTLAEEHHWRSEHPTPAVAGRWARLTQPGWHGPACQTPAWVEKQTAQRVQRLGPARVAVLYRSLRKAQEDNKDEPGAADFYYGEMEMRRKAPATPWPERFILWWYWLLAGYGLRGLRAVTALLAVVTGLALLLQHIGFNGGDPSLRDALIFTAQSTLSLDAMKTLADHVSWAGDVLRIVLRLSGPLLLGLALLSIRNRVKR